MCTIDESDVKRILDKDSLEKYLFKKERLKILAIKNRFHCLTPNCMGYFVKNDTINSQESLLKCQICNEINCLRCQRLVNKSDTASHECNLSIEDKIADPLKVYLFNKNLDLIVCFNKKCFFDSEFNREWNNYEVP